MGHKLGQVMSNLLAIWITVAVIAAVFGGRQGGYRVVAAPFRIGGWVARGLLGAAGHGVWAILAAVGRGFAQLLADAHRHLYGRWPGATLLGYTILLLIAGLYIRSR